MAVSTMLLQARRCRRGVAGAGALVLAMLAGLAACGGGGDPPAQTPPARIEVTGLSTDGAQVYTGDVTAKGASGLARTNAATAGSAYAVNMTDLTPPFLLQGRQFGPDTQGNNVDARPASVATGLGHVNITPLTDLLVQVMFGQPSATTFASYGAQSPELVAQITDANIAAAQAQVVAFLRDRVGVTVANPSASFITTPFQPVAGDPTFDSLVALRARQAALGATAYQALVDNLLQQIRLCRTERLAVNLAGVAADFCPASRSATPEDADSTIVAYRFTSLDGDVLTVRARDTAVLTAQYGGADARRFDCSGAGCAGITLGATAADLTRPLGFANLSLAGSSGTAVFNGTLLSAIPGVALPNLPCSDNRFFLIEANRNVIASCLDGSDGSNFVGVAGQLSYFQGTTDVVETVYRTSTPADPLDPTIVVQLAVTLRGDAIASAAVIRGPLDFSTGQFVPGASVEYRCRGGACAGITVGPATINDANGFPVTIRDLSFDDAVLSRVLPDGSLSADPATASRLRGTVTSLAYSRLQSLEASPLFAADCAALPERVTLSPSDEANVYATCNAFGFDGSSTAVDPTSGDLVVSIAPTSDQIQINLNATTLAVSEVRANFQNIDASFGCRGNCTGVVVGAPDAGGNRVVTFNDVPVRLREFDGFYAGDRTAILSGSYTVPPPPPPTP